MNQDELLQRFIDMNPTEADINILLLLRTLAPYEFVKISADQGGKPDTYIVTRSQKVVFESNLKAKNVAIRMSDF